ncbi:MAG TPA: DNA sulfur modification protein DndB [Solirubrobacterales bacterium]|nr:DNA sulfur modification protein DndB [Solirubrobacterales bacterium]
MTSATSVPSKSKKPKAKSKRSHPSKDGGEHRFQSVRAVQAGRAYFVTACPLRLVPQVLTFAPADLPPNLRAQRLLNKGRIPQIAKYLTANPTSYVLSAITASIDADLRDVRFEEHGPLLDGARVGQLVIPAGSRILVNDGQHRREAIAAALQLRPELADESIPLVLFLDAGLVRNQQTFADLNRHAIRPATSLNVLYDHRDPVAELARRVSSEVCPFDELTELEKSSLSNRSSKMFTLSAIHQATVALLGARTSEAKAEDEEPVLEFWRIVGDLVRGWGFISVENTASDLRRDYVHVHAVALHALGTVGGELMTRYPDEWQSRLRRLDGLDWRRDNPVWVGRAIRNGKISKAGPSLVLTANVLRQRAGLELGITAKALEQTLEKEDRVSV